MIRLFNRQQSVLINGQNLESAATEFQRRFHIGSAENAESVTSGSRSESLVSINQVSLIYGHY